MTQRGPIFWGQDPADRAPHFQGLWLGDDRLRTGTPPATWKHGDDLPTARAIDGSDLIALHVADPTRPVSFQRWELEMEVQLLTLDDKRLLRQAESMSRAGETVALFWGEWDLDVWSLPLAPNPTTAWRTHRGTPWHLVGIDPADYQPKAWVLDPGGAKTDLAVVGANPGPAEVVVPGGPEPFEISTHADLQGDHPAGYLVLWYPIVVTGRLSVEWAVRGSNSATAKLRFIEAR